MLAILFPFAAGLAERRAAIQAHRSPLLKAAACPDCRKALAIPFERHKNSAFVLQH
jgi:hypothetical protein